MKAILFALLVGLLMLGCGDDIEVPKMIACDGCRKTISSSADDCPNCGHPVADSVDAYKEEPEPVPSKEEPLATNWVNGTGKVYVTSYFVRVGSYPKALSDLKNPPNGIPPFVKRKKDLEDPWGKEYVYKYPGTNNPRSFDLSTTTPDGKVLGNWDAN